MLTAATMGIETILLMGAISSSQITLDDLRKEFPVAPRYKPMVEDAISRYRKLNNSPKSMNDRFPIIIEFADKRCVILKLRTPSVGGEPIYCYGLNGDTLVEYYDGGE